MIPKIIHESPPNIEQIDRKFHVRGTPILYAFGDRIYNPAGVKIPPQLMAHEVVHLARQQKAITVELWWQRYIEDAAFRLQEEIPAHQAEYLWLATKAPNRHERRGALKVTAKRLAAPLYGGLVTAQRAAKLIKEVVHDD